MVGEDVVQVVRVDMGGVLVEDEVLPEDDDEIKRLVVGLLLMVDEMVGLVVVPLDVVEEEVVVDVMLEVLVVEHVRLAVGDNVLVEQKVVDGELIPELVLLMDDELDVNNEQLRRMCMWKVFCSW